jgi:ribosomal protein S18 acetylase RimI-like enzyme
MTELIVRRAGRDDARRVAEIHLAAWREAYDGLVPPEAAAPSCEERSERWRASFADPDRDDAVLVVSRPGGAPEGFIACGPVDNAKLARAHFAAEIYAIYILKPLQRQGAGRLLTQAAARHLVSRGMTSAGVWVLRDNAGARRFYEALGATETGIEGVWPVLDMELPDLAYGWRDLRGLAGRR